MQSSRPSLGPASTLYSRIDPESDAHEVGAGSAMLSAFDSAAQQAFSNSTESSLLYTPDGFPNERPTTDDEMQSRDRRDLQPMSERRGSVAFQRRAVRSEAALSRAGSAGISEDNAGKSGLRRTRTSEPVRSSNVDELERLELMGRSARALSSNYDSRSRTASLSLEQLLLSCRGVIKLDCEVIRPYVDVESLLKDIAKTPFLEELHIDFNDVPHDVILGLLEQLKPAIQQHSELREFSIRIKDRPSNLPGELQPLPASMLASLADSPVTVLSLGKVDDADVALGHLGNMPRLEHLQLGDGVRPSEQAWHAFIGRQIDHVESGCGLRKLDASGLALSEPGFESLASLPTLAAMSIDDGSLGTRGAQRLAALKGLRELTLTRVKEVHAESASALAQSAAIEKLEIIECGIDTNIANRFSEMPKLNGLRLDRNPEVRLSSIFGHDLTSNNPIAAVFMRQGLQHLSVRNTGFTDRAASALRLERPKLNLQYETVSARLDPFVIL